MTLKVGFLGRALAIFRVDRVVLYREVPRAGLENAYAIKRLLEYMECPQYLRKLLFKREAILKYAGLLPPLRTPHHPLKEEDTGYREGVVLERVKGRSLVYAGLDKPVVVESELEPGSRVTLRIAEGGRAEVVSEEEVELYWGFKVEVSGGLVEAIETSGAELVIATSKYGVPLESVLGDLERDLKRVSRVVLVFGSRDRGLFEISREWGIKLEDVADYILNFVPLQGVETVRTEEAVYAVLSILNFLDSLAERKLKKRVA